MMSEVTSCLHLFRGPVQQAPDRGATCSQGACTVQNGRRRL
ncbi:unnamed protein product [Staurois parvus]|uniref:Uncharacterized protein n=1 Tax=Staurois parvus TaxID=386267 RepID=A0ABN9CIJ3_9NEOB|nr:unnamed protein product [Staurois parvus]